MATEVQSGDLDTAPSSRLEVSIDGLTLSPDPEGEQGQVEEPEPEPAEPEPDTPGAAGGEDGETGKSAIEGKWGFPLLELYGMALKFFKGTFIYLSQWRRSNGLKNRTTRRAGPLAEVSRMLTLAASCHRRGCRCQPQRYISSTANERLTSCVPWLLKGQTNTSLPFERGFDLETC